MSKSKDIYILISCSEKTNSIRTHHNSKVEFKIDLGKGVDLIDI